MADVTLPNMGLVQPSNGGSSGSWGTKANENFAKLDVHDHTPGLGPKVPVLGIDIDDDLSFVGEFAPIHLHHLSFDQIAATPGAGSFFVNSADHELYFRNFGSASIKITSGSELNVAAFTGGFIGDYAAAAARAFFDSGANQYKFTDVDSKRSVIQCGSIQIVEFNAIESTSVTLAVPAALATPYTIEMPLAPPGSTSVVQMSSTGVLTASNTVGDLKHGTRTLSLHSAVFNPLTGSTLTYNQAALTFAASNAGGLAAIPLKDGDRVLAIRAFIQDNAIGPSKLTASFYSCTSTGTTATIASSSASAGSGANQTLTIGSLTTTIASSTSYGVQIQETSGTSSCSVYMIEIDYDRP